MPSALFSPLLLREVTFDNRIVVSPMCQHSAVDGYANDWHAALVMVESTAIECDGRISQGCLGLWSDAHEEALARVVQSSWRLGNARLGIQLSHSGRKGSSQRPWEGGRALTPDNGAWTTLAPSALPFDETSPAPRAVDSDDMAKNHRLIRYSGATR